MNKICIWIFIGHLVIYSSLYAEIGWAKKSLYSRTHERTETTAPKDYQKKLTRHRKLDVLFHKNWIEIKTQHFTLITDMDMSLTSSVSQDLQYFHYILTQHANLDLAKDIPPLNILAISEPKHFKALGAPSLWTGFYIHSSSHPIAIVNLNRYTLDPNATSEGKSALFHEYFHHLMSYRNDPSPLPNWYKEGLAEYFSTLTYNHSKAIVGNMEVLGRRFSSLNLTSRKNRLNQINSQQLLSNISDHDHLDTHEQQGKSILLKETNISKYYARSTAVTHFFKAKSERREKLDIFLQRSHGDNAIENVFFDTFKYDFKTLDRKIENYILSNRFYGIRYRLPKHASIETAQIRPLTQSDATIILLQFIAEMHFIPINKRARLIHKIQETIPFNPQLQFALANINNNKNINTLQKILSTHPAHTPSLSALSTVYYEKYQRHLRAGDTSQLTVEFRNNAEDYAKRALQFNHHDGNAHATLAKLATETPNKNAIDALHMATQYASENEKPFYLKKEQKLHLINQENAMALNVETLLRKQKHHENTLSKISIVEDRLKVATALLAHHAYQLTPRKAQNNTFIYINNAQYIGETLDQQPHGTGILQTPGGYHYQGHWKKGQLSGFSTITYNRHPLFQGNMINGSIMGHGTLIFTPTSQKISDSKGYFHNGIRHGRHHIQYKNGDRLVGNFNWGVANGHFVRHFHNGKEQSEKWVLGQRRIQLDSQVHYVGPLNTQQKANGSGLCTIKSVNHIFECHFRDGVRI